MLELILNEDDKWTIYGLWANLPLFTLSNIMTVIVDKNDICASRRFPYTPAYFLSKQTEMMECVGK